MTDTLTDALTDPLTSTLAVTPTSASTAAYSIDKAHSDASFQVRHLLTKVRGRFSDFSGTIAYDEARPDQSAVQVTIQAASIDTNEPARDTHLRSADFFEVDVFPTLTFTSTRVSPEGANRFAVEGALTIHGVTKPVTLAATFAGRAKDPWGQERVAFEAETTIHRKDFGLVWNAALETGGFLVGDEVVISLTVQAVPLPAPAVH